MATIWDLIGGQWGGNTPTGTNDKYYDPEEGWVRKPTTGTTTPTTGGTPTTTTRSTSTPLNNSAAYDFLLGSSPYLSSRLPAGSNEFRLSPAMDERGSPIPGLLRFEFYFRDFSGGLDLMRVEIAPGQIPNMLSHVDGLNHQFSRTLCLGPLVETDTAAGKVMGSEEALHVAYVKGDTDGVIAAGGSTSGQCLFRLENAANLIGVTALTYNPGSVITCLSTIQQATTEDRLLVGRTSGAAQILSGLNNAAPTVDATMHADLTELWGHIVSPLDTTDTASAAGTNIFYAGNKILTLATTAATGTQPTTVLTGVPSGGYALGTLMIEGSHHRAYFAIPAEDLGTTHVLNRTTSVRIKVLGVNFEADDPQYVDFGLQFLTHAMIWREGIVVTNGETVLWHNGRIVNLGWGRQRKRTSDRQAHVVHFEVVYERLFAKIEETDSNGNVVAVYYEEYILEENKWYRYTPASSPGTTTTVSLPPAGRSAVFQDFDREQSVVSGDRLFWYETGGTEGWRSVTMLPSVVDPFYWQNTGESYRYFGTSGSGETPVYDFMDGFPKIVTDVTYKGELKQNSSVRVDIASQTGSAMTFTGAQGRTFVEAEDWRKHFWMNNNPELLDRLQFKFTGTRDSSLTRTTPNILPVVIGGYVLLDGMPRVPAQCEPWRFRWRVEGVG